MRQMNERFRILQEELQRECDRAQELEEDVQELAQNQTPPCSPAKAEADMSLENEKHELKRAHELLEQERSKVQQLEAVLKSLREECAQKQAERDLVQVECEKAKSKAERLEVQLEQAKRFNEESSEEHQIFSSSREDQENLKDVLEQERRRTRDIEAELRAQKRRATQLEADLKLEQGCTRALRRQSFKDGDTAFQAIGNVLLQAIESAPEQSRAKTKRQLLLCFHPDKNPATDLAHRITQLINSHA